LTARPPPQLFVIGTSEAFSGFWPELAERNGLALRRLQEPETLPSGRSVAAILVIAGDEGRAFELLHQAERVGITAPVVVGAEMDHRLAVELMRRGAVAYYALPGDASHLEAEISERASAAASETRRDQAPEVVGREVRRSEFDFGQIAGEAPSLLAALDRAARVIPGGRATVLIEGETGTGKELFAQAIHKCGPRANKPFVAVNCSAIPANLLESELFGHEKGAFTDARTSKPGLFQVADGGTLFLDEVAIFPLELQGKLLRALETRSVRRVGGLTDTEVDVRIIAAANVDLAALVRKGSFREDLYFRLAVVPIRLPPLRERDGDVMLLARRFLTELAETYGLEVPAITPEGRAALERHPWPGNVRELRNAIERGLLLAAGQPIRPEHLALSETELGRHPEPAPEASDQRHVLPFPTTLERLEEAAARAMLDRCDGNKSRAARDLGITRSRLYRILERGDAL